MRRVLAATATLLAAVLATAPLAGELPEGYMPESQSERILEKTLHIHLDPDISALSEAERGVVDRLIEVGRIFQRLYEVSRHRGAQIAYERLLELDEELGSPSATQNLITMVYLFKGPIARTLDNTRKPFLPVEARAPGGTLYPWGVGRDEVEAYLEKEPEARRHILDVRTVVRRAGANQLERDLTVLDEYPVLDTLHPGLRERLERLAESPDTSLLYAVPYAVAFALDIMKSYRLLMEAGDIIAGEEPEFAAYLQNRARDLLSNDYESGDASWVTGQFEKLNAQIGAYEVYDDELYGVKAFFGLNVLLRDREASAALGEAVTDIQNFENSLPYEPEGWTGGNKKTVRADIPVGVYNIIADFGQSRGTNTATILPNESEHARKYGRTILLRANIMRNPEIFEIRRAAFRAAVAEEFHDDLAVDGGFHRTLWHEIGHYLGPDRTRDGRDLDEALTTLSSVYEELKADLVSLYLTRTLEENGYYTSGDARAVYASGMRRVLLKSEPQRSQPYQTMELMQLNYYLENGLLEFDETAGRLVIHYDRYHGVVASMLREVLALQYAGDSEAAEAFVEEYTTWSDDLHEVLARSMKQSEAYRYAYVTYGILETAQP
jgi:hypothetical protein